MARRSETGKRGEFAKANPYIYLLQTKSTGERAVTGNAAKSLPWATAGCRAAWLLGVAVLVAAAIGNSTGTANWGAEDFAFATVIFGLAGIGVGVASTLPLPRMIRAVAVAGVALIVALIWIEAAVGIFD